MSVSPIWWALNVTKWLTLHLHSQMARDVSPESMGTLPTRAIVCGLTRSHERHKSSRRIKGDRNYS